MHFINTLHFHTHTQGPDDLRLSLLVMRKTLAVMQVITLCQCGGSFHCLPKYVSDGRRKRYHAALHSLEQAVDKIAIMTTAIHEPGITMDTVSGCGLSGKGGGVLYMCTF